MNRFAGKDNDMMRADQTPDLSRLLRPKSIAVVGGGAWCQSVVEQCRKMGFDGPVWPVHPKRSEIAGVAAVPSLDDLPGVPDATFIGVNRHLTIDTVRHLRTMGRGRGDLFCQRVSRSPGRDRRWRQLAGHAFGSRGRDADHRPQLLWFHQLSRWRAALAGSTRRCPLRQWCGDPDPKLELAINLTMQARGLPLAYVVTAGNQAQIGWPKSAADCWPTRG